MSVRDIGRLAFIRIRDAGGAIQVVAEEPELVAACRQLKSGWAVTVDGDLVSRPRESVKVDDATGAVELNLRQLVVIAKTSAVDEGEAPSGAARLEDAARDALRRAGFENAGVGSAARLSRYLPRHERVYRVRTVRVADGGGDSGGRDASVLELELAFAAFEDLTGVVRAVYGALEPLLPRAGTLHDVPSPTPAGQVLERSGDQTLLLAGLPVSGHAVFGGRDLCVTMLARPSPGSAEWVECVVLIVRGRVVGAGSVLTDDYERALQAMEAMGPLDPMTSYELEDAVAAASSGAVPGRAWFALDLERLGDAASLAASVKGDVELLRRDFSSVICIPESERLGPGTPAAVAAAARLVEQREVEAYSALARSRSAAAANAPRGAVGGLDPLLADFAMEADVWEALLELDPGARERLERRPPGERFQWLWSILGNEHVRAALRHRASYDAIRRATELGVVTDLQQLRYLDRVGLDELSVILDGQAASSRTVRVLRQALALSPAPFTSLLAALAATDGRGAIAEADAAHIVEASRHWLCAPGLLELGLRAARRDGRIDALLDALRAVSSQVLLNSPVDPRELIESFAVAVRERVPELSPTVAKLNEDLAPALVQHVFRPISLTYSEAQRALAELPDRCEDVGGAGLATGGRHWSAADACYVFPDPPGGRNAMRMYLSKNTPSFLAKATVGICTSRDAELWARPDHSHLNVVDPGAGIVVGNIQLHVMVREGRRILLMRAVNASTSYLTAARARAFVEGAVVACLEIAAASEIDELHLCESLSFWHLNSSRPEIRAVLEPLYSELASTVLEPPFFLFRFGGVDLEVTKTYRLWERDRRSGARFRLRGFLEVVA